MSKTLNITDSDDLRDRVEDAEVYGDAEWVLLYKASSESQGWMKSTKVLPIENLGCLVQVTTQQTNPDDSYSLAEAVTFVPNAELTFRAGRPGPRGPFGIPNLVAIENKSKSTSAKKYPLVYAIVRKTMEVATAALAMLDAPSS